VPFAEGPYSGKETGETALLRSLLDSFSEGDVVVADRYYCSFMMIALLRQRKIDVCARLHQARKVDFRRGRRLGPDDHLITWTKPARPEWMDLKGARPKTIRKDKIQIDPDLLQRLYQECGGWIQRIHEKLVEEHKIQIGYPTLTRLLRELGRAPWGDVCLPAVLRDRVDDRRGVALNAFGGRR